MAASATIPRGRGVADVTSAEVADGSRQCRPPGNCTMAGAPPSAVYGAPAPWLRRSCFSERAGKVWDLISGRLAAIRIRKMAVCHEHGHLAELTNRSGFVDRYRPAGRSRCLEHARCRRRLCRERTLGSCERTPHAVRRHVDAILRNRLAAPGRMAPSCASRVACLLRRAMDDGIPADRIVEWSHQDVRAGRPRRAYRLVQVGHEVACPLHAERIRDRRLESETEMVPTGVSTSCDMVLLGVGVTVKTPCLVVVPPNVATRLATKRSKSSGGHRRGQCRIAGRLQSWNPRTWRVPLTRTGLLRSSGIVSYTLNTPF